MSRALVANSASVMPRVTFIIPATYSDSSRNPVSETSMDLNHSSTSDSVIVGHTPHAACTASSTSTLPSPFTSSA